MGSIDVSGEGSKEGNGNGRIIGGNGSERIKGGNDKSGSMEGIGVTGSKEGIVRVDPWRE